MLGPTQKYVCDGVTNLLAMLGPTQKHVCCGVTELLDYVESDAEIRVPQGIVLNDERF